MRTSSVSTGLKILLAHDDRAVATLLVNDLKEFGYSVVQVKNPSEALEQFKQHDFVLGIIDARFPAGGLQCCERLRLLNTSIPLLILMSQENIYDRMACLDAGADDYILNPYQRETFLQRIRLYLQPTQPTSQPQLEFDDLSLNLSSRTAKRGSCIIDLTMKEFELLRCLMEHPRNVLSRDQILENVWGFDYVGESNVIEVYIRYLRLKLEAGNASRLIHTVRGVGYVLREA